MDKSIIQCVIKESKVFICKWIFKRRGKWNTPFC